MFWQQAIILYCVAGEDLVGQLKKDDYLECF